MNYEAQLATPSTKAYKGLWEVKMALYDLASVYSSLHNFEMSGKCVEARDTLEAVEKLIAEIQKSNEDALMRDLEEAGMI